MWLGICGRKTDGLSHGCISSALIADTIERYTQIKPLVVMVRAQLGCQSKFWYSFIKSF